MFINNNKFYPISLYLKVIFKYEILAIYLYLLKKSNNLAILLLFKSIIKY